MGIDEELMKVAQKRALDRLGFYTHLTIYVVMGLLTIPVWWYSGDALKLAYPWFVFVFLFWGVGIIIHGMNVFVVRPRLTEKMAERQFKKLKQEFERVSEREFQKLMRGKE